MSAVLKLPSDGSPKNIYLIYDFKQVADSILMVMYVDKLNAWKKIFINYEDDAWDTNILINYTDDKTYHQICNKLKFVFSKQRNSYEQRALYLEQAMQENAAFMLGTCC